MVVAIDVVACELVLKKERQRVLGTTHRVNSAHREAGLLFPVHYGPIPPLTDLSFKCKNQTLAMI